MSSFLPSPVSGAVPRTGLLILSTCFVGAVLSRASEGLLVYEDFPYPAARIAHPGKAPADWDGGLGWIAPWSSNMGFATRKAEGLRHVGSPLADTFALGQSPGDINCSALREFAALGTAFDAAGDTIYFSLLVRIDAFTRSAMQAKFLTRGNVNEGFGFAIAGYGQDGGLALRGRFQNRLFGDAIALAPGLTHLLVGKVTRTAVGYDYALFVNPGPGNAEPREPGAFATIAEAEVSVGDFFNYTGGASRENDHAFDELRLGTSFSSVTAAP